MPCGTREPLRNQVRDLPRGRSGHDLGIHAPRRDGDVYDVSLGPHRAPQRIVHHVPRDDGREVLAVHAPGGDGHLHHVPHGTGRAQQRIVRDLSRRHGGQDLGRSRIRRRLRRAPRATSAPAGHRSGSCTTCHGDSARPGSFTHPSASATCTTCHTCPRRSQQRILRDLPRDDRRCELGLHAPGRDGDLHDMPPGSGGHRSGSCTTCHGVGTSWAFTHPGASATCTTCHSAPAGHSSGSCTTCHGVGTSWAFTHPSASATCTTCHSAPAGHSSGSCATCHGATVGASWAFTHPGASANCTTCHSAPAGHRSGPCATVTVPRRRHELGLRAPERLGDLHHVSHGSRRPQQRIVRDLPRGDGRHELDVRASKSARRRTHESQLHVRDVSPKRVQPATRASSATRATTRTELDPRTTRLEPLRNASCAWPTPRQPSRQRPRERASARRLLGRPAR